MTPPENMLAIEQWALRGFYHGYLMGRSDGVVQATRKETPTDEGQV